MKNNHFVPISQVIKLKANFKLENDELYEAGYMFNKVKGLAVTKCVVGVHKKDKTYICLACCSDNGLVAIKRVFERFVELITKDNKIDQDVLTQISYKKTFMAVEQNSEDIKAETKYIPVFALEIERQSNSGRVLETLNKAARLVIG